MSSRCRVSRSHVGCAKNKLQLLGPFGGEANMGKRKPYWVSWDKMTMPRYMGGLGFRDFELFNLVNNLGGF